MLNPPSRTDNGYESKWVPSVTINWHISDFNKIIIESKGYVINTTAYENDYKQTHIKW